MSRPNFKLSVDSKTYNIEPSFRLHDEIENALDMSLYDLITKDESLKIGDLFNFYKALPCKDYSSDDQLKEWLSVNRNEANSQFSNFILFLLMPEKQEEAVKKK